MFLAYALAKLTGERFLEMNEESQGVLVADTLIQMHEKHPGLVQNQGQLEMAITLAHRLILLVKVRKEQQADKENFVENVEPSVNAVTQKHASAFKA